MYHHQSWLHQLIKARFSRRNAKVQNTSNKRPCPRVGIVGSIRLRSRARIFSENNQVRNKHRNVRMSTPATPPFSFIKSLVTTCDRDSSRSKTVKNICKIEPTFVLMYCLSIFVEYFLYIEYCKQPKTAMNKNKTNDDIVSKKHLFIPSSIHTSVNSVPFEQYNILIGGRF